MKCAALTMVYNDPEYLPIWCKYYGAEFGPQNCFIIDHGSDDGSTQGLGNFNVVRIPRSPKDNDKRTRYLSAFASSLLEWYGAVVHADVDEIAVVDPNLGVTLSEFMLATNHKIISAIGFDLYHLASEEPDLDLGRPVLSQRSWLRFSSSMCKPIVVKRPVRWSPGFHSADSPIVLDSLYLFHLRYFDLKLGLARLERTRSMAWASEQAGSHQRVPDETFRAWMAQAQARPKIECELLPGEMPLDGYLQRLLKSELDFRTHTYNLDLHIFGDENFKVPARFVGKF